MGLTYSCGMPAPAKAVEVAHVVDKLEFVDEVHWIPEPSVPHLEVIVPEAPTGEQLTRLDTDARSTRHDVATVSYTKERTGAGNFRAEIYFDD